MSSEESWISLIPQETLDRINESNERLRKEKADPSPRDTGSVLTLSNGKGQVFDINVDLDEWPSNTAKEISTSLVAEWLAHFLEKNAGYGEMHKDLGLRAQYIDIHRKVKKLKRAFWDNEPIGAETPREVLMDLIGHCFLTISLLDEGETK